MQQQAVYFCKIKTPDCISLPYKNHHELLLVF